jgi:3-keto-5-aminohexanoate cleavage enzyme
MKKILVAVAPVCHETVEAPAGVKVPYTPEEVAEEVLACARRGAAMVHLHVRDDKGRQTSDLRWFRDTLDRIRAGSDIIIQGSTGGVAELSLEERCVSLNDPRVEVASLNMGSANMREGVYINTLPDIRFWAARMMEKKVIPEMEIFDLSMIDSVLKIHAEGLAQPPLAFNFCLGFENALRATPDHLFRLKQALPANSHWGVVHDGMKDFSLLIAAACLGASTVRVGFEDGFFYQEGRTARSPSELVERLVDILARIGFEPMTPDEARNMMHIASLP